MAADIARVIVCTYGKAGTGFSPVRFTTAVIWSTTRKKLIQCVGRITRWNDADPSWNTRKRVIYDYADRSTVCSQHCWYDAPENGMIIPSRMRCYAKLGFAVENMPGNSSKRISDRCLPGSTCKTTRKTGQHYSSDNFSCVSEALTRTGNQMNNIFH
jgi:hypothetical protein